MRTDRPGYQSRVRADGTLAHYWNPQRAVSGCSKALRPRRLPDDLDDAAIVELCRQLTDDLRAEVSSAGSAPSFDGTIASLVAIFKFDPTSPLHSVKHSTRVRDYEPSLRVLVATVGKRRIDRLVRSDFIRWYTEWKKRGHRRAYGAMKLLRLILSFGAGERLPGCRAARDILSDIRFDLPAGRDIAMTYRDCLAIVEKAPELGMASVGFVEALKFETGLRRIDVIGEWAPADEGPFRWSGPTADRINKDLIFTTETSKTGAAVCYDLKVLPLVMKALESYRIPDVGPIVFDEDTGRPYRENHYPAKFRTVRSAAGVSDEIWSMDTRAGAVTETVEATGSLEAARKIATHTSVKMTKRYARDDGLVHGRKVAAARVESRK